MINHSEIINNLIVTVNTKKRHKYYDKTVDYAVICSAFVTGKNTDKVLRKYAPRENDEAFKQRVNLTHNILKGVNARIMSPFDKGQRSNAIKNEIILNSESSKEQAKEYATLIANYWGEESLSAYMNERFKQLSFTDPNSFIIVEKTERYGEEIVYPYEVSSAMAVNLSKFNNVLEWLIVQATETSFTCYTADYDIKVDIIDKAPGQIILNEQDFNNGKSPELLLEESYVFKTNSEKVLQFTLYDHGIGEIQAIEVGYLNDPDTNGLTYLCPFDSAIPRMENTLQTISELNLTTRLHAFPQKYEFVEDCDGAEGNTCRNGIDLKGNICSKCNGSGIITHTSSQDVIRIKKPKDSQFESANEILKLSEYSHYQSPPVDLVKFQNEYTRALEKDCIQDVFVSEAFTRETTTATATEINVDMDSVYDTIHPYLTRYSQVYRRMAGLKLSLLGKETQVSEITHTFPKDLKIKSITQLFNDLKTANEASAPESVKRQINDDIANKMYQDDPFKLKRYKVLMQHEPFANKNNQEKILLLSSPLTSEEQKVLWTNFDSIINDIENELSVTEGNFYELPYKKREELIDAKVKALIQNNDPVVIEEFEETE